MKIQKEKLIIILTVLVDVIGIGVVIPVMPFYVESFGVSAFIVTLLFSIFSLLSFISTPFLGALSDKIGRRPVLILSIMSTAIGWFIFASAKSIAFLFLGRIIDGMAAGNYSTAQSYLSDIARNEKERTSNLGLIGAVFGIGFIIGPMLGGFLSSISHELPFWFVGILATLNVIGAIIFLPETHKNLNAKKKIDINPLRPLVRSIKDKSLRSRYIAWFLLGVAIAFQQSIFALYLDSQFGISASIVGYIFTVMGVIMVINQGFLLKHFWLKYFKESTLEIWLFLVFTIGFILMDIPVIYIFALGMILLSLSQSVLRVVMSSSVASIAGNLKRGEALGVMASIMSIAMVAAPPIAGFLFQQHKNLPFLISAFFVFLAFIVMNFFCTACDKVQKEVEIPQAF